MGRPKALMEAVGRTFLSRTIEALAGGGCDPVLAVIRTGDEAAASAARCAGARVVWNPDPASDPVVSLRLALFSLAPWPDSADARCGIAVLPVDHPWVTPATVAALLRRFRESRSPILRPTFDSRPGHPTIFARALFAELCRPDLPEGARTVIERHASSVEDLPVPDRGVIEDLDTPEEARAAARRRGSKAE